MKILIKILRTIAAFICAAAVLLTNTMLNELVYHSLEKVNRVMANSFAAIIGIAFFLLGFYLCSKIEGKLVRDYGISWNKKEPLKILHGLEIGVFAIVLAVAPLYLLQVYKLTSGTGTRIDILIQLITFISVGFTEEYLCRGFIQHHLLRFGPYTALIVTSIIFGLLHFSNPGVTVFAIINIILAGCFMGSVMYAFNSIHAAVGVHITWNWVQGAVFGIPVSGTDVSGYFSTVVTNGNQIVTGGKFGVEGSIACTIVTLILTLVFLRMAYKNGNIAKFKTEISSKN